MKRSKSLCLTGLVHHIRTVGKYLNSTKARCAVTDTGIEGLDVLKPSLPLPYRRGLFLLFNMNKTKKRAAKRAASKVTTVTRRTKVRRPRFRWPHPLTPLNKIPNLKAYREYCDCTLLEAKTAIETAMSAYSDILF